MKFYMLIFTQKVKSWQKIAGVGTTGYSTGPHLHYQVSLNGETIDGMSLIDFTKLKEHWVSHFIIKNFIFGILVSPYYLKEKNQLLSDFGINFASAK